MTANFSLEELLASDTAIAAGIANSPGWSTVDNLDLLATVLEEVRSLLGDQPIRVSSGFRCAALNAAVGGASNSAHLDGLACDFTCPDFGSPLDVCRALEPHLAALGIDQLIHENASWIHLGLCHGAPRAQCLTIDDGGTREGFA